MTHDGYQATRELFPILPILNISHVWISDYFAFLSIVFSLAIYDNTSSSNFFRYEFVVLRFYGKSL